MKKTEYNTNGDLHINGVQYLWNENKKLGSHEEMCSSSEKTRTGCTKH